MRPCQAAFKVAKPTGASQSSEMDLQDSPAVEEVPSHPDISTGPVTPEMQAYFKEADKKRAHEKGLFVAGGLQAMESPHGTVHQMSIQDSLIVGHVWCVDIQQSVTWSGFAASLAKSITPEGTVAG